MLRRNFCRSAGASSAPLLPCDSASSDASTSSDSPVVPDAHRGPLALPLDGEPDVPAGVGVLGGVVEQVEDDLRQPRRVPLHPDGRLRRPDPQAHLRLLEGGPVVLRRLAGHAAQVEPAPVQGDLAARQPAGQDLNCRGR